MISNLIIGLVTTAICVAIQCIIMARMLHTLYRFEKKGMFTPNLKRMSLVLIAITLIILTGNLLQVALWAGVFMLVDEFQEFSIAFYHSVVNFSTLGYGDMVMSERYRLLGALEALNGVLMIGLSTGALFAVLNELMQKIWDHREDLAQAKVSGRIKSGGT